ncbi:2-hexaprenyl-6-methoxy-1,4-benzoquinone methyltransferase [Dinochytrium kinnereticum]|nr:2-hexaprenyl-6-methoxy-1,4-benzoquinone methyltransferase [Dinochytrium kinnereticum]
MQPLSQLLRAGVRRFHAARHCRNESERLTHFGFKTVAEEAKEAMVGQVFRNVADKYDVMNDFMSAGVHRLWKDHFIRKLSPGHETKLLDVAGGTAGAISFTEGNAEDLAFVEDNSVDAYTIAFGIRNCTHIDQVIREAHRVLKPGGRFMVLEFSHVNTPGISSLYDLYSFNVIPALGGIVANDRDSYQYLVESIRKFPPQKEFARMIQEAGFTLSGQGWEDLTFGVAAIHSGFKLQ